jgi:hypothetical protein
VIISFSWTDALNRFFMYEQGGATLEAALDWLCLNLPPNELPSKFSSGIQVANPEGTALFLHD